MASIRMHAPVKQIATRISYALVFFSSFSSKFNFIISLCRRRLLPGRVWSHESAAFFCVVHHTATKMNFETCNQRSFRAFSLGRTSLLMWFCFLFADFVFAFWFKMRRRVFLRHEFHCWGTRPLLRLWTVGLLRSRFLVAHARAHLDFGVDFLTYNA